MKVSIDSNVFSLFPDLEIFGLALFNLNLSSIENQPIKEFYKPNLEESERVVKIWKETYKMFPTDKQARASINYLTKASHDNKLRKINPLVDIYNEASLLSLAPFGGEDINLLKSSLKIGLAKGNEPFLPLGKEKVENPKEGEVVYLDGENKVVCRSLNWLESDLHKITEHTKNVIFVSEKPLNSLPSSNIGMDFLFNKLKDCCSSYNRFILDKNKPSIEFNN
ncbi:MAG: hypothetical protein LBH40_04420 [Alphaproteobacteria bacterium]|jgi:DNA/RNA-binding domain of Phe-tRNA-synthetase-like protein|nr:hypothetical protein [Alphaproteobacteria bacterium]